MSLCGSRRCGCVFASGDIRISGSGQPGDPLVFSGGFAIVANAAGRPSAPNDGDQIFQQDVDRHFRWDAGLAAWIGWGFGPWKTVTPSTVNITLGTSTHDARYRYEGDSIRYKGQITFETGFSITGNAGLTLPDSLTAAEDVALGELGTMHCLDFSSTTLYPGTVRRASDTTIQFIHAVPASNVGRINATAPFTWAVDDTLQWNFLIEVE